jgi:hypothetical protein
MSVYDKTCHSGSALHRATQRSLLITMAAAGLPQIPG